MNFKNPKARQRLRAQQKSHSHQSSSGRVMIPQWRMRKIRYEEAMLASRVKRGEVQDLEKLELVHFNCGCGAIDHLGGPCYLRKIVTNV